MAAHDIVLGSAVVNLMMRDDGFTTTLDQAESALKSFGDTGVSSMDKIQVWSDQLGAWGSSLTKTFTAPLLGLATSSVNAFRDTESAFVGVTKTIDETSDEFKRAFQGMGEGYDVLDDAIWRLTQETSSSYEEIAKVMEWAGQLGVPLGKGGKDLINFTKIMVELGDTTNLTAEMAAENLAKFMNIVGTAPDKVDNLGAAIVDLGNNYATTEADIVALSMRLAGAGKQIGLTEPEILGFATALSSVGITAEMGGSAFSKMMVKMQVAAETGFEPIAELTEKTGLSLRQMELMSTNDAKSFAALADSLGMTTTELKAAIKAGNDLSDMSKIAQMSTKEFVELYRKDAPAALQAFIHGLGDTENQGESTIAMLQDMGITEVRLRDTMTRLANSGDLVTEAIKTGNEAWNENAALSTEAEKRYATLDTQVTRLKESWKEMCVDIAEYLTPAFSLLADTAQSLIDAWKNLDENTKQVIVNLSLILSAIGPVLLAGSQLLSLVGNMSLVLELLTTTNPLLGALAATIGVIALGFKEAYDSSEDFRNLLDTIRGQLDTLVGGFRDLSNEIGEKFQPVWDALVDTCAKIVSEDLFPTFSNILGTVTTLFEQWKPVLSDVADLLADIATEYVLPAISTAFSVICDLIDDHLADFEALSGVLADIAKDVVLPAIRAALEGIAEAAKIAWPYIENIINKVSEEFTKRVQNVAAALSAITSGLKETDFSNVADNLDSLKGVFELLAKPIQTVSDAFSTINSEIEKIQNLNFGTPTRQGERFADTIQWIVDALVLLGDTAMYAGLALADMYNYTQILMHPLDNAKYVQSVVEIEEELEKLKQRIGATADSMHINFATNAKQDIEDFAKESGMALEGFGDTLDKESQDWSDVITFVDEDVKNLNDSTKQNTEEMTDSVITFVDDSENKLRKDWHDVITFVDEDQSNLAKNTSKDTKDMTDSVITFVDEGDKKLKGDWHDVITFVDQDETTLANNTSSNMANMGQSVITFGEDSKGVLGTVRDDLSTTGQSIDTFSEDTQNAFRDMSDTSQYGKDMISNLKSGMEQEEWSIKSWLEDLQGWIEGKFNDIRNGFGSLREAREAYDGSYANGLDYVPYNGFVAQLHKGERVLTRSEAEAYNSGSGSGVGGDTFNFYNTKPDPYEYARQMKRAKKELLLT